MDTRDTDVSDLHISFNTSADFEFLAAFQEEHMDDLGRGTLHRLHNQVVLLGSLKIHYLKQTSFHLVFKWRLAKLALQGLPKETFHFLSIVD